MTVLLLGAFPAAKRMSLYNSRYTGVHGCSDLTEIHLSLAISADAIVYEMV
jgi:hypothetical protein